MAESPNSLNLESFPDSSGETTKPEESLQSSASKAESGSDDVPLTLFSSSRKHQRKQVSSSLNDEASESDSSDVPLASRQTKKIGNRQSVAVRGPASNPNSRTPQRGRSIMDSADTSSRKLESGSSRLKRSLPSKRPPEKRARVAKDINMTHDESRIHCGVVPMKNEPVPEKDEPMLEMDLANGPFKTETQIVKKEESYVAEEAFDNQNGEEKGYRWWDSNAEDGDEGKQKWTTLSHNAVVFPPEYEPHGVPLVYNGQEIVLEPKGEEIATFYAAKLETDYVKKETFRKNFFEDFRASLKRTRAYKIVKDLDLCDFSRIHQLLEEKKAVKKELPAAEKKKIKEAEQERLKKFTVALVDGREEKVGNFRVEPPGLFLGRGDHPKMGKVKARLYPEDFTLNIGEDAEVPPCPVPNHQWGKIVHKHDVTWLCGWKDSITGGSKYVWLAAGSAFKGMSDHAKFEKARKLSDHIESVRADYRQGWSAASKEVRQRSVAMYLIDKLALRVGNEKGDEEADTVGCCSLRVEHIEFMPNNVVKFDFLGKDSIRYYNEVEVEKQVYDNLLLFCRKKSPKDAIFHRLTVTSLNDYLKSIMDGLSAKVFRTYNASYTLDRLLQEIPPESDLNGKVVFYNQQNKEVAILCNHQRTLPKQHESQMEKLDKKLSDVQKWITELKRGKTLLAKKKDPAATVELTQFVPEKPVYTEDMDEKARAAERKRAAEAPRVKTKVTKRNDRLDSAIKVAEERAAKIRADIQVKDDLKTVALGTSKINYLDPRITVAWCKKHEVPIEKIFQKTLLVKFAWAMEVSETFRF